jgi:dolichyl-phosphate beta-glucosyltransferase
MNSFITTFVIFLCTSKVSSALPLFCNISRLGAGWIQPVSTGSAIFPLHVAKRSDDLPTSWGGISSLPATTLTVILPAYNEESRIQETIEQYGNYLTESNIWNRDGERQCEILVVDDGSQDDTVKVVQQCGEKIKGVNIRYVSMEQNEGKGAAVATGIHAVRNRLKVIQKEDTGCIVLVADADGSGDIRYMDSMVTALSNLIQKSSNGLHSQIPAPWKFKAMIVGNRDGNTSLSRIITRWGFRTLVKLICGDLNVDDTQCGFKMMTLDAGLELYSGLNLKQWTHDVEVLYRARESAIFVAEMKIGWEDKSGSKLASNLMETIYMSGIMLSEIIVMRIQYLIGRWHI